MFGNLQAFVLPFIVSNGATVSSDTIGAIVPTTNIPVSVDYVPSEEYKTLIFGVSFGTPREYDTVTGTIGPEVFSTDIGVYITIPGYVDWHWIPLVDQTVNTVHPIVGWVTNKNPLSFRLINDASTTVWFSLTFWLARFPRSVDGDPEEKFREYMSKIVEEVLKR